MQHVLQVRWLDRHCGADDDGDEGGDGGDGDDGEEGDDGGDGADGDGDDGDDDGYDMEVSTPQERVLQPLEGSHGNNLLPPTLFPVHSADKSFSILSKLCNKSTVKTQYIPWKLK